FDHPVAIAGSGAHLFVANAVQGAGSLTEVDAATAKPVRVIAGGAYEFDRPVAVAVSGAHLFVANASGRSLTELDGRGASGV
ncbi:MAG: hypothetical protein ACRDL8_11560, partial [Solirubrobacteraceae bacterium]